MMWGQDVPFTGEPYGFLHNGGYNWGCALYYRGGTKGSSVEYT